MKKILAAVLLITALCILTSCQEKTDEPVLWINPEPTEYWTYMSSTPGIALTAVLTLDLKNSDFKYHWIAEQGTFLMWHGNDGQGRLEDLGRDIKTNVHKLYWTAGPEPFTDPSLRVYVTVENIETQEVIAETYIEIQQPEEGHFVIDQ